MKPESLVSARGKELGVEVEEFLNIIRFLTFVNIDIDCVAFPTSEELDVVFGDAVAVCSDSSAFM